MLPNSEEAGDYCSHEFDPQADFCQVFPFFLMDFWGGKKIVSFQSMPIFSLINIVLSCIHWISVEYQHFSLSSFFQFLKEAKSHTLEESFKGVPPHVGETRKADTQGVERKKRKSWKSSLFSWLKMDRKNKTMVEVEPTTYTKVRRGAGIFSGPIIHSNGVSIRSRSRKPTSGPLPSLFNPSMADEIVPYMCLNQQFVNPHSFGPVYLVT